MRYYSKTLEDYSKMPLLLLAERAAEFNEVHNADRKFRMQLAGAKVK